MYTICIFYYEIKAGLIWIEDGMKLLMGYFEYVFLGEIGYFANEEEEC